MSLLYIVVAVAIALISATFILTGPRTGVAFGAAVIAGLFLAFQQAAGIPAAPDGRLSGEQWRVLAISPLDGDQFLRAQQGLKKGKPMVGRAARSRAGLADDDDMGFEFADAPQADLKDT